MIVPVLLFVLSVWGLAVALAIPDLNDFVMLAGPCAAASFFLVLRALRWRAQDRRATGDRLDGRGDDLPRPPRKALFGTGRAQKHIIVDGSNVLHWNANQPDLETVRLVVAELAQRGLTPGVIFDANVGYKIGDRYQDDAELAGRLGLPAERVLVVPKGEPADDYILRAADRLGTRVVTNDRYRDWAEAHPRVQEPGYLIRGGMRDGQLWLNDTRPTPMGRN